jgi:L-amino acid N-acyltransferase YncA
MPRVSIRPARPRDIPHITGIYAPAVLTGTASFELVPPSPAEMLRRYRTIVDAGFPYLAAEIDGVLAGYAYASAYRPRSAYRFTVEDSVYVAPSAHGKGVGTALLSGLITASELRGDRQMIAVIGDSAQAASIALHARAGFTYAGLLPTIGHKFGRWVDIALMQRPLGEGRTTQPSRIVVAAETPDQTAIRAFLEAGDAYSAALYPAESNHMLDIAALLRPSVRFFVARRDDDQAAVGCGAVVIRDPHEVEIKRMWVDPGARGAGCGRALLTRLEAAARREGASLARLETGIHNTEALGLYRRMGYAEIPAFGSYAPDPRSIFMEKQL